LYAAHTEGSDETVLLRTGRHQEHLYKDALALGISVTCVTEVGNVGVMLPKRAEADKADLVCYPLTPDERYESRLRLHTIHNLERTIRSDLAIMRIVAMVKPHPTHILVPFGTVVSDKEHRLAFITLLAKSFQSQVTLFCLSTERSVKAMPDGATRFREKLQQQQITVLERHGSGDIAETIGVEAITRHNDLIVLGATERGVLHKAIYGNPAADIMRQPPCNTILFRPAR
jgi:nucleotide-binding universal stress UspA family protein